MLMRHLIPDFKNFFEHAILSRDFDYIIPIESKGMLIVNEIASGRDIDSPKVMCSRAFDFIPPEKLKNAKVAVIDDTVFSGKTLNKVADDIKKKGVNSVEKFAFLRCDTKENIQWRRLQEVTFSETCTKEEFELIAEDLAELSVRARPSNPDHLIFRLYLEPTVSSYQILNLSYGRGDVVEYCREQPFLKWTVHDPDWSPLLNTRYSLDSGPNKLRFTADLQGYCVDIAPCFFPALNTNADVKTHDSLCQKIFDFLHRDWHIPEVRERNLYESFTLSQRLKLTANFIADLKHNGISVRLSQLYMKPLLRYFGTDVASNLEKLCVPLFEQKYPELEPKKRIVSYEDVNEPFFIFPYIHELGLLLYKEYIDQNQGIEDHYERMSIGLDIEESSKKLNWPRFKTNIIMEHLNDYGMASPIPTDKRPIYGTGWIRRSYRSTEVTFARIQKGGEKPL